MDENDPGIQWLLKSDDPSIRYLTLTDLLDADPRSRQVTQARKEIVQGKRVRALLAGQGPGKRKASGSLASHAGGFGVHPYKKWDGAHWRLVSLVELGIPSENPQAHAAADQVLCWLTSEQHINSIRSIGGRMRRCASQEGNALAVCSRLGMTDDPRVRSLAESLVKWQWEDGGWNCDVNPNAAHSSFYESLAPLWGLIEFYRVTRDEPAQIAADCGAELFLSHQLFRSDRTGNVINQVWLKLHYPLYWHYDILQGLVVLSRFGKLGDPRTREALKIIADKRQSDGTWRAEGFYWKPGWTGYRTQSGAHTANIEVANWGRRGPNEMITLNALRVLRAAE